MIDWIKDSHVIPVDRIQREMFTVEGTKEKCLQEGKKLLLFLSSLDNVKK